MTERMLEVLRVLAVAHEEAKAEGYYYRLGRNRLTPNQIGQSCGFRTGSDRYSHNGKMMGAANRVNFSLTRLRELGYVDFGARPDGRSGTAYYITGAGLDFLLCSPEKSSNPGS